MTTAYVRTWRSSTYYLTNVAKTRYYKSSLHQVTGPHVIDQTVGLLTDAPESNSISHQLYVKFIN